MPVNPKIYLPPLGAHMSIAGGTPRAIERARSVKATALQIFLKNNNQWLGKPISGEEAERFRADLAEAGMEKTVVAHSGYLINLASPDPVNGRRSLEAVIDELKRAAQLGVPGVVIHPGAHMGQGEAKGLQTIAERINQAFAKTAGNPAALWLETTAGQGTALGYRFEHLAEIIGAVEDKTRIGICMDTCHVFAAGYEMRTEEGVKATLHELDRTVGLAWLRAIHVNDSKKPLGSRRDRHEHIGKGEIGKAGFAALIRDGRLRAIPFILETPKGEDLAEDRTNLAMLRRLARG